MMYCSGITLSFAGKEAYWMQKIDVKSLHLVYDVSFQWLLEAVQQSGEDTFDGEAALICDSVYNTLWI